MAVLSVVLVATSSDLALTLDACVKSERAEIQRLLAIERLRVVASAQVKVAVSCADQTLIIEVQRDERSQRATYPLEASGRARIVSLAIVETLRLREEPTPAPVEPPPPEPSSPPPSEPSPVVVSTPPKVWRVGAALDVRSTGAGVVWGPSLLGRWRTGLVVVVAEVGWKQGRTDVELGTVGVHVLEGSVGVGARAALGRFGLSGLFGARGGWGWAMGFSTLGDVVTRNVDGPLWGPWARAEAEVALGPALCLGLFVDGGLWLGGVRARVEGRPDFALSGPFWGGGVFVALQL